LEEIRAIYKDCAKLDSPERAARVTAFAICVMLDGSGEHSECPDFRVVDKNGEKVNFYHHDL